MASLDEMEGDVLEIVVLLVVILIAYLAWEIFNGAQGLLNPWEALKQAWQQFLNALLAWMNNSSPPLQAPQFNPTGQGASSPFQVMTGTNVGNMGDGTNMGDYTPLGSAGS